MKTAPEQGISTEKNVPATLADFVRQWIVFRAIFQQDAPVQDSQYAALMQRILPTFKPDALPDRRDESPETHARVNKERVAQLEALEETAEEEGVTVHNAGLVLLNPFLPHFFRNLDMLDEKGGFKSPELADRGALLLEYLATKQTEMPEFMLVLNKLLCGIPITRPIPESIEITPDEQEMAESLLQAVISQWSPMSKSSVDGLRGAYIVRNGLLSLQDVRRLTVEKKAYDILLGQLPWSFSIVRLKWMEQPLFVQWG